MDPATDNHQAPAHQLKLYVSPLVSTRPLVSTSTLTVATANVSVYRAMFTLSGDNAQYQPLLSTFNGKKRKIKKYDHIIVPSDVTKQTILRSH